MSCRSPSSCLWHPKYFDWSTSACAPAVLITFQGPTTVVTDLAFPRAASPGNYLAPNPISNPVFGVTGQPINGGLGNLSFSYNNITLLVPCTTLQNYVTLLCRNEVDSNVVVNRWGIVYVSYNAPRVRGRSAHQGSSSAL
jgi:hypothetical protein